MSNAKEFLVIDIETTGFNWRTKKIHGIGFAFEEDDTKYVGAQEGHDTIARFRSFMGHNLRFDLRFLIQNGYKIDLKTIKIWDTKIICQLINENRPLGLKPLSIEYLGAFALENKTELDRAMDKERCKDLGEFCRRDLEEWNGQYSELIGDYGQEDCNNTLKIGYVAIQKLKERHEQIKKVLPGHKTPLDYLLDESLPLEPVLLDMDLKGVRINVKTMKAYKAKLLSENTEYMAIMRELCKDGIQGIEDRLYKKEVDKRVKQSAKDRIQKQSTKYKTIFNWQSPAHMGQLFYKYFDVPDQIIRKTNKGAPSTSEPALVELGKRLSSQHPLKDILSTYGKYKKNLKNITTYIGDSKGLSGCLEGDRVFPEYMQTGADKESDKGGTVTGRLSAKNPPIQTLPRDGLVRQFYIPDDDDHVFLYLDYSQVELRIAAHLSQDKKLLEGYRNNVDLHQLTANRIGQPRQVGKKTNFSMIFNATPYRLAEDLSKLGEREYSFEECKEFIQEFFGEYYEYKAYLDRQKDFMIRFLGVISEAGRIRKLPDLTYGERISYRPYQTYKGPVSDLLYKGETSITKQQAFVRARKKYNRALNQGYNFPIQSLGASIAKRAMVELWKKDFNIVTQMHDSIVLQVLKVDAHRLMKEAQYIMENVYTLSIPLVAEPKLLLSLDENDTWEG